jgi:hypothetical protein
MFARHVLVGRNDRSKRCWRLSRSYLRSGVGIVAVIWQGISRYKTTLLNRSHNHRRDLRRSESQPISIRFVSG